MMVQKRGAERGAASFDRSLNLRGCPQNAENPRKSRLATYHYIYMTHYMIKKGARKGVRPSRILIGLDNAIYIIYRASKFKIFT